MTAAQVQDLCSGWELNPAGKGQMDPTRWEGEDLSGEWLYIYIQRRRKLAFIKVR